jgi:hypothetical protein
MMQGKQIKLKAPSQQVFDLIISAVKKIEINDKSKKEDKKQTGGKKGPAKK